MEYEPYDVNRLDEIIVFDGSRSVIYFSRDGKYINLFKEGEEDKRYYRFNLQTNEFERVNFYKTVDDKVSRVDIRNITSWFTDCKLVTTDVHFGRLVVYAKNSYAFDKYSSPVRFIQQLGHRYIKNLEQWEALGVKFDDIEEYFGDNLVHYNRWEDTLVDHRKDIYLGRFSYKHSRHIHVAPSACSKELLNYIKEQGTITIRQLHTLHSEYNNGEWHLEQKLKALQDTHEFADIFEFEQNSYAYVGPSNALTNQSPTCQRIRSNMYRTIKDYSLDLVAFCRWIKKQKNVEKNDVEFLFDTNHYRDYLRCEFELKDGSYSKMIKYPDNFRTEFHKAQVEFEAVKGDFDEFKFRGQKDRFADYEHTGRKFCMIIPEHPDEIKNEATELHHCVRTYIKPMTEGKTLIMFMRDKKYPQIPLITVEVKNGVIRQAYGNHDSKPLVEHLDYIRHWARLKGLEMGCWGG